VTSSKENRKKKKRESTNLLFYFGAISRADREGREITAAGACYLLGKRKKGGGAQPLTLRARKGGREE